ncbi:hypothetical protein GHT06_004501 [Daphnia sinensis]|uniref:Tandem-95 repeat protein n=1 Tax=Daphnia sinensis TaxID=1820382 RepID=A0AAD5PK45_9CRUS|nr:hypothetical protein GHT06_004501 [Daphnia sinensis]
MQNINGTTTGVSGYNASFPTWMKFSFDERISEVRFSIVGGPPTSTGSTVKLTPSGGTYVAADAMLITNGINTYIIDDNPTNTSEFVLTGANWTTQANTSAYSDGDGCADAIESLSSTTAKSISVFPTGTDDNSNGLLNNYESTTTAGTINYTSKYNDYALVNTINYCLDNDKDGVPDLLDLDDDNDGILDTVECSSPCPQPIINGGFESPNYTATNYYMSTSIPGWKTTNSDSQIELWVGGFNGVPAAEGDQIAELNANQIGVLYQKLCVIPGSTISWSVKHRGRDGIDVAEVQFGPSVAGATTVKSMSDDKLAWGTHTGTYQIPLNQTETYIVFKPISVTGGSLASGNLLDDVQITVINQITTCDTDNDGILNVFDTDSDNDGCSDANEAYGTSTAQGADGNMFYGTGNPPAVDADGKVIGASYAGTSVNVTTAGAASTITTQPSDKALAVGVTTTSFTAAVTVGSGTSSYQWQVSADGGATWTNITNNTMYSGASTTTLTLTGITSSMNEYKYRLTIAQSDFVCGNVTSNAARLILASLPTIVDESATTNEDTPITGNVLTNDSSASGGLTVSSFTVLGSNGTPLTGPFVVGQPVVITECTPLQVNTLEFGPNGGPVGNGPTTLTTVTFSHNTDNPTGNTFSTYANPLTVTASLDNHQYTSTTLTNLSSSFTGSAAFGVLDYTATKPIYSRLNLFGQPIDSYYTTPGSPTGTGVSVSNNYSLNIYIPTDKLQGQSNIGRYQMADITLNFNRPVDDPVMNLSAMGAWWLLNGAYLYYSAEMDLVSSNTPITLSKLSGTNPGLAVTTLSGVQQINNGSGSIDYYGVNSGAGSVQLTGTGITSVKFRMYLRAGGKEPTGVWPRDGGELFLMGLSVKETIPAKCTTSGTLTLNSNGSYTFVPAADFNGIVPTIEYTSVDNAGGADVGALKLNVTPVNDAPVAINDVISATEDTLNTGNVLTNDTDADGNPLTVSTFEVNGVTYNAGTSVSIPDVGTILINADGSFTFTPALNYTGNVPDINYTISDGKGGSDTGLLDIVVSPVNDAPLATDDILTTSSGATENGNVKTNDTDLEGNALTVTQFTIAGVTGTFTAGTTVNIPNVGSILINSNGTYTFISLATFSGDAPIITYTVSDGNGGTDTAVLDIYVAPVNAAPVAANDSKTVNEDNPATGNVILGEGGVGADSDVNANTTLELTEISFTVAALTVTAVNDEPIAVNDDNLVTPEDSPATGNVLDNDSDPEGNSITVTQFTIAGISTVFTAGTTATIPNVGTLIINANGSFIFTPAANYNGPVPAITYTARDSNGGEDTAFLNISVSPLNDNPIAVDDSQTIAQGTSATGNILTNDTDAENAVLSVTSFSINGKTYPAGSIVNIDNVGTLIVKADGSYNFTPLSTFSGTLPSISYELSDGSGGTDTGALNITVTAVNTAPVANDNTASTPQNTNATGNVLTNDTDVDGNTLSVSQFTVAGVTGIGTLTINADGSFTFVPATNYYGPVPAATYTVSDGNGGTDTGLLNLSVSPVDTDGDGVLDFQELLDDLNDPCSYTAVPASTSPAYAAWAALDCDADGLTNGTELTNGTNPLNADTDGDGNPDNTDPNPKVPTATNDSASATSGTAVVVNILANDDYLPNDGNTITKTGGTATGTVSFDPVKGEMTYTPAAGEAGTSVTIIYQVCQGTVCATATVTINVAALISTPSSPADSDGDGVTDAQEALDNTNPNDPCDYKSASQDLTKVSTAWKSLDCDQDGLTNNEELTGIDDPATPANPKGIKTDMFNSDSDGDGVSDAQEALDGTNPNDSCDYKSASQDLTKVSTAWKSLDCDQDGLTNNEELTGIDDPATPANPKGIKTDMFNSDSDGDGVSDAQEALDGTNPNDSCDYKSASQDLTKVSTAWKSLDCDNDGLSNNEELTGIDDPATPANPKGIKTDMFNSDSDGDGVSDAQEALDGTNPNDSCDYKSASQDLTKVSTAWKSLDCDQDGLSNNEELTGIDDPATPANPKGIKTDMFNSDSDGDGVSDAQEALDGTNPNDSCDYKSASQDLTKVSTAWKSLDCDQDGLSNNEELTGIDDPATPANPKGIKTDPRNPDTDGDGVSDAQEALDGTNPNDSCDYKSASQDLTKVSTAWKSLDCDNDGLTNNEELTGIDDPATPANPKGIKTDLRNPDSDGDGVSDAQEALDGTNPNDPCSFKPASQTLTPSAVWSNGDCDGDGVTNGKEKADATNPLNACEFKVASRTLTPSDAWKNGDCDGDGLKNEVDGIEDCDKDGTPNFLDPESCNIDILMANVFTPNGDGINDEIKPVLLGINKFICFKVYNRWGNLVFETKDREKGWDGDYRESGQGTETFQWLAEGYDYNGQLVKRTGMITLLR